MVLTQVACLQCTICTVQSLYNAMFYNAVLHMNHVLKGQFYKRNYRKMTISFHGHFPIIPL